MCGQKTTPGSTGQAGASQTEQVEPEERSGFDMQQPMRRMMEHCSCGPGMMDKMAGLMCGRPSKPADPASPDQD